MPKALPDGETLVHEAIEEHQSVKETLPAKKRADSVTERDPKMVAARQPAPTRPHLYTPNTPPGNLVGGVAAEVMDTARDARKRD